MQEFQVYIKECMDGVPAITGDPGAMDLQVQAIRDTVNFFLSDVTDTEIVPERAYERVRGVLGDLRYMIPPASSHTDLFVDGHGEEIIPLVHRENAVPVFLYFAYTSQDDTENYEILAEIVTTEELEEILNETE